MTSLVIAGPSAAAAREPLIVSQLRDPDPGPAAVAAPRLELTKLGGAEDQETAVDRAVESFTRALGEAVSAQQQATEARCRTAPPGSNATDRFAWAANCRYNRH